MPQLVVTAVLVEGRGKSEVACDYGVSRRRVITLVQRYLAEGDRGLLPRSRRPLRSPTRTADELEEALSDGLCKSSWSEPEAGASVGSTL